MTATRSRTSVLLIALVGLLGFAAGLVVRPLLGPDAAFDAGPGLGAGRGPAKNVIFVSGDGMGAAQREAARLALAGRDGRLQMDELPISGSLTTDSRDPDTPVTDSAAAATAWSTGQKTYNGAISVDLRGRPLRTLGQLAKQAGKATGLVTTTAVTDASPAAFFASTRQRHHEDEIARQYLTTSQPDVLLGGGEDWWYPEGTAGAHPDRPAADPEEGSRGTEGNLVEDAQRRGYAHVTDAASLAQTSSAKVLGLFANQELYEARAEGQGDAYRPAVSLPVMAAKALDILSAHEDGFFLFVEEEAVDSFGHVNNGARMLDAMRELDATVAVARRFVASHPDTLLVVTGDHECGGLTVEDGADDDESGQAPSAEDGPFTIAGSDAAFRLDWTTGAHTGVAVPVTAMGPGAERFAGQHPNTRVHEVLSKILG